MSESGDPLDSAGDLNVAIEELEGENVDVAFTAVDAMGRACVDSECNKIVLIDRPQLPAELVSYKVQVVKSSKTAVKEFQLAIVGKGFIESPFGDLTRSSNIVRGPK